MNSIVLVALLVIFPPPMAEGESVAGLLVLPDLFEENPCGQHESQPITVYTAPEAQRAIGSIRVDRLPVLNPEGGCEPIIVNVHRTAEGQTAELPRREYGYELPAAIVLERRGSWFKLRLDQGSGWIQAPLRAEYLPLEGLLRKHDLTDLTEAWDGALATTPGGPERPLAWAPPERARPAVRVKQVRRVRGRLWIDLEVISHSFCKSTEPAKVLARGWVPAHDAAGEATVWFASRGC